MAMIHCLGCGMSIIRTGRRGRPAARCAECKKPAPRTCRACGATLGGRRRLYCEPCAKLRQRVYEERSQAKKRAAQGERRCENCHAVLLRASKYCGTCAPALKRERDRTTKAARKRACSGGCGKMTRAGRCRSCARGRSLRACPKCGAQFWPWEGNPSHGRRYCQDNIRHRALACARRQEHARKMKQKLEQARQQVRHCPWCYAPFIPKSVRSLGQKYCCIQHQNIHKSKRRKARLRGARFGEPMSVWALYRRDEGICGICRAPVSSDARWPDPGSPSVDRVRPLSKGGTDASENLQLAHLGCNLRKSAKLPGLPLGSSAGFSRIRVKAATECHRQQGSLGAIAIG